MPSQEVFRQNPNELERTVGHLVDQAAQDTLTRLPSNRARQVEQRLITGLNNRFLPYLNESLTIAEKLNTPEYKYHTESLAKFLGAIPAYIGCSDGRVSFLSIFSPGVGRGYKRPRGLPLTRKSTRSTAEPVLLDPEISAAIENSFQNGPESPEILEMTGQHILTGEPPHGCGAAKKELMSRPGADESSMAYGGIIEFHQKFGDGFHAFENIAKKVNGKLTAIDLIHDAERESLIIGSRDVFRVHGNNMFDKTKTLRQNLIAMHKSEDRPILMTELLDSEFSPRITAELKARQIARLNFSDTPKIASNLITIDQIAASMTSDSERSGYGFIPETFKIGLSPNALRTLAFTLIRNCVFRISTGGARDMTKHTEQLLNIGPTTAPFNRNVIPLTQADYDMEGVDTLYGLAKGISKDNGINPEEEATIMLVSGTFDPNEYSTSQIANRKRTIRKNTVQAQASKIRDKYQNETAFGRLAVISVLADPKSRVITDIIRSQ